MLSQEHELVLSEYSGLYDIVVPQDNLLRCINALIDFSFVYQELVDKYCSDNGRMVFTPCKCRGQSPYLPQTSREFSNSAKERTDFHSALK